MGAYDRITFRGKTLNRRTVAMILLAEEKYLGGRDIYIIQGSYNGGVSASAGTHDGGGAIDVPASMETVIALRKVGFAAWYRTALPGVWNAHVHAIAIGDKQLSSGARAQVTDYYNHRNGLASHAYDSTWRPNPIPVFKYGSQPSEPDWHKWLSGPVYVHRLHKGVQNSDSVRRLKAVLKKRGHDKGGTENLKVNGDYGGACVDAVRKWANMQGTHGPDQGFRVERGQARRIFGPEFRILP